MQQIISSLKTMDEPSSQVVWSESLLQLLQEDERIHPPADISHQIIINKSEEFPVKFPLQAIRCKTLMSTVPSDILDRNCNSAYPLVHELILSLYGKFILFKRQWGTAVEKEIYKNLTILGLVDRLLSKRAVSFVGAQDCYTLLDGSENCGSWKTIGTEQESGKLKLDNYISYDEVKLSAFLSVSSYTYLINDGSRNNRGKQTDDRTTIQNDGIIVGLIGARFEKPQVMEYQDIVISQSQNIDKNGYGNRSVQNMKTFFADFYDTAPLTYEQMAALNHKDRFRKISGSSYFDNEVFAKRIRFSIDTLLLEANTRARKQGKFAFVHVVGIGLGVWSCSPHQDKLFLEICTNRIENLGKNLDSISDIFFAYIDSLSIGSYENRSLIPIKDHPKGGIKVFIGQREPHVRLRDEDENKLLVVSYAWDGNALPGNEFWLGALSSSGDPAAAASTQIAELHNPHVNPKVCAANLRVVTVNGVITFQEYCKNVSKN